jgi:hypothetical protein
MSGEFRLEAQESLLPRPGKGADRRVEAALELRRRMMASKGETYRELLALLNCKLQALDPHQTAKYYAGIR